MGEVGQENKCLLSSQLLFASFGQFESAFVGLNFGFTRAPVIIVVNDLGQRPSQDGTDNRRILEVPGLRLPT